MARIGIDYTAALNQSAGIGRYVRELTAALAEYAISAGAQDSVPLRLFVAGARLSPLPSAPPGCDYCLSPLSERMHARLWHRLRLPLPVERWTGPLDLFHATDFTLPPTRPRTRTVLTIHDLSFERYPQDAMPGMLGYLRRVAPRSARRANHVIAVSESTRRDLIELYRLPPEKITVIPHGVSPRFQPLVSGANKPALPGLQGLPDGPVILTVGTLQPRKNHLRLVQAFARLRREAVLVIAGGRGWAYDAVQAEVARLGLAERVIFAGFVDDGDLPALYRAATVFAYPALYEGFGLPVLEAMASGVPAVAASTSSLSEVAGDAALLVDPLDVDVIAAALDHLLDDDARRADLRRKGLARAAQFTWARAARQTWGVYNTLLR